MGSVSILQVCDPSDRFPLPVRWSVVPSARRADGSASAPWFRGWVGTQTWRVGMGWHWMDGQGLNFWGQTS